MYKHKWQNNALNILIWKYSWHLPLIQRSYFHLGKRSTVVVVLRSAPAQPLPVPCVAIETVEIWAVTSNVPPAPMKFLGTVGAAMRVVITVFGGERSAVVWIQWVPSSTGVSWHQKFVSLCLSIQLEASVLREVARAVENQVNPELVPPLRKRVQRTVISNCPPIKKVRMAQKCPFLRLFKDQLV